MIKIKLNHGVWEYDLNNPIGKEGGFGIVYVGKSERHENLAVKKLKINAKEAAHRELEIAEELSGRELEHVISIYDSGLDAESDSYFIIMDRAEKSLQDEIESTAISAKCSIDKVIKGTTDNFTIENQFSAYSILGNAQFGFHFINHGRIIYSDDFSDSEGDVVLGAEIAVKQNDPEYIFKASLWYSKMGGSDDYRWREVYYRTHPMLQSSSPNELVALTDIKKADQAASKAMSDFQIAWGPKAIDDENSKELMSRWASIFADAAQGKLNNKYQIPN